MIDIELRKPNRFKIFFQRLFNKLEDLMFAIVQRIPERFLIQPIINWLDRYITKRINELKQQNVKNAWRQVHLDKVIDDISSRQQD